MTPCFFCVGRSWRPLADPHAEPTEPRGLRILDRPPRQARLHRLRRRDSKGLREGRLLVRVRAVRPPTCFEIGEAAGRLRTDTPVTWSRLVACVADAPEHPSVGELPVHRWPPPSTRRRVLLAAPPPLAGRLLAADARVIQRDDRIPS